MNLPLAPVAAVVLGGVAALVVAAMPSGVLESFVVESGLPSVLAQAEPPLGTTARLLLAGGTGALVGVLSWLALFVLVGTRSIVLGPAPAAASDVPGTPILRRADAHPDAPPRPPLLATRDLGTPFLEVRAPGSPAVEDPKPKPLDISPRDFDLSFVEVPAAPRADGLKPLDISLRNVGAPFAEAPPGKRPKPLDISPRPPAAPIAPAPAPAPEQRTPGGKGEPRVGVPDEQPLPADLDQPLAAFDPSALPASPVPPPVPMASLRRPRPSAPEPRERMEVFALTPPAPCRVQAPLRPDAITNPETEASVHALLERLERGASQKGVGKSAARMPLRAEAERGLEEALVTLRNLARGT